VIRVILVTAVLLLVARHYDPVYGFTSLIGFAENGQPHESRTLQAIPHYRNPGGASYDGQYYAQLALDPLLLEPDTGTLMDSPPMRARRILLPMTAYVLGLGRRAAVLQAYAVQNVLFWLVFAWWLARRFKTDDWRGLAIWAACLLTFGMLGSVRAALIDGPSLLLVAIAVSAAEEGHVKTAAAVIGVSVLARETNILAAVVLLPLAGTRRPRVWELVVCGVLLALPGLLWFDYLRSIYRSMVFQQGRSFAVPLVAFAGKWSQVLREGLLTPGAPPLWRSPSALVLVSLTVQAVNLLRRPNLASPWWRVGAVFTLLMLSVSEIVWEGEPGATARVVLPMTLAFNLTLPAGRSFWVWWATGNLACAAGVMALLSV